MSDTSTPASTDALQDRIYRDHRLRHRVKTALRKRPDVAENAVMALLAETYLDGARDGDALGFAATCREAYTDKSASDTP